MARAIGVDIGDQTVKVVELTGSARSFKVQRVAIRPIPEAEAPPAEGFVSETEEDAPPPPTRDERTAEVIRSIFKDMALPKEDTSLAFHARSTMIRELTVPFFESDQIKKVVRFEAENHLHSHSIDDVVVNWIKTGETKDGSRLTVFASPKDKLAEQLAIMRRAAIDPASVDLDATALYTAMEGGGLIEQHPTCIILHVGATSTNLVLVVERRPRIFRSFPMGTGALEDAIAAELSEHSAGGRQAGRAALMGHRSGPREDDLFATAGSLPAAENAGDSQKSLAQLETDAVAERRTAFVQRLHREVIRSLAAVRTEAPPERLLMTGGGSLLPGVPQDLAERFGLPVETIDILDHVPTKDRGQDPEYAGASLGPAIGCALRMLGRNPLDIELLKDEFAPSNTFDVIRTALATLLTLGFLALAVLTLSTKRELSQEKRWHNERLAVAQHVFKSAEKKYLTNIENLEDQEANTKTNRQLKGLNERPAAVRTIRRKLQNRHRYLEEILGISKRIDPIPSAVEVWYELYKALDTLDRDTMGFYRVLRMDVKAREMRIEVLAERTATLSDVRKALNSSEYFRKRARTPSNVVEVGSARVEGGNTKQTFTIKFEGNG